MTDRFKEAREHLSWVHRRRKEVADAIHDVWALLIRNDTTVSQLATAVSRANDVLLEHRTKAGVCRVSIETYGQRALLTVRAPSEAALPCWDVMMAAEVVYLGGRLKKHRCISHNDYFKIDRENGTAAIE